MLMLVMQILLLLYYCEPFKQAIRQIPLDNKLVT